MTVSDTLKNVTERFIKAGIPDAVFDAKQIVAASLKTDASRLSVIKGENVDPENASCLEKMVEQRIARIPLQYILGEWEFYGLPFYVGEGVLIPRPDTETLVEMALILIKKSGWKRVIDLCSGSGCISVAIGKNAPDVTVTAVELYDIAYNYTIRNIERNQCRNIQAVQRDLFDGPCELKVDLIVSNPPYIPAMEISFLSQEVGKEPVTALDGGADGLDFYRAICKQWIPALNKNGGLMVEVGIGQAESVARLFRFSGLSDIEIKNDLCGVPRVVYGINL